MFSSNYCLFLMKLDGEEFEEKYLQRIPAVFCYREQFTSPHLRSSE